VDLEYTIETVLPLKEVEVGSSFIERKPHSALPVMVHGNARKTSPSF